MKSRISADSAERAEVQAYRRLLAEHAAAKTAFSLADRARVDTLRGPLTSTEAAELAFWKADARLDEAKTDLDETDPALVKVRRFLDASASALVAVLEAAGAPPKLASVDYLAAHADELVAHADGSRARAAAVRVRLAWAAAHDALALVASERVDAKLPGPVLRGFSLPPHDLASALAWLAGPLPFRSSAYGQIERLERQRADRAGNEATEEVALLTGPPGQTVIVPREPRSRAARIRRAERQTSEVDGATARDLLLNGAY